MLNCPNCSAELKEFEGDFICKSCKQVFTEDDLVQAQRPWYENLCTDDSLWHKKVFDEYPSIIAHEYWRLYDLLNNGQTYGAFWQLKDLFEVLLKFPTLIVASAIYAKRERSDVENKILIALLEKHLSLGDWHRIAGMCKKFSNINKDVVSILKNIVSVYDEYQIANWRNNEIGHGALKFDVDHTFKEDIEEKIALITRHLEDWEVAYSKFQMYLMKNGRMELLHGKDNARNLACELSEIFIEIEDFKLSLSPYILLRNQGVYFFDSYYIDKDSTALLNYPDGKKSESRGQEIPNNFVSALYKELEIVGKTETSLEDETYSAFAEETLNEIASIDDFQKPVYIEEWLSGAIKAHSKGVFLLQMERGMGKTMYTRALDEQSLNKSRFKKNFSIRAYYIDSAYLYRVEIFTDRVTTVLRQNAEGKIAIQPGSQALPQLSSLAENPKHDFATLLNFYRRQHQRHFGKKQLLFIIDGLDEVPAKEGISIFEFIPHPDMLDVGIYLLLTCRTEIELVPFTQNNLKTLELTENACFQKNDEHNIIVLTSYIKNKMKRTDSVEINTLLSKAENRFLYLKMLKELLTVQISPFGKGEQGGFSPGEFPEGKALFESFLDHLKSAYGEKFFAGVIRLLAILATAFEPLTVQEISYLYGEERLTFKLLAHLIDLRGFLNVERSYRGNLISLGHEELKELVKEKYTQTIQELVEEWIENSINLRAEDVNPENDGETYLLAYLLSYANQYLKRKEMQVSDSKKFFDTVAEVAFKLANISLFKYHREREVMLCSELIEIGQWLLKQNQLDNKNNLVITLENRGMAYHNLHRLQEAMSDFNQAILMVKALLDTKELSDENTLAHLLAHRGAVYDDLQYPQEAIADYNQAIEIQQRLLDSGKLLDEADLAKSLMSRGYAYHRIQQLQEAICDHSRAIEIWQEKSASGRTLNDELNLAGAFMNRGAVYLHLPDLQKAIDDSNQAITIYQRLSDLGKLKDENELAKALMNRGTAYKDMQIQENREKAIDDYNRAIVIQQKLFNTGRLPNKNEFAMTLSNRGIVYDELQISQEAIADYSQAITILQQLMDEGNLLNESDLATVLLNRGVAYRCLGKLQEAITDYTQAILIQQRLLDAGILLNENDIATTLMNRALAYGKLHKFHEAISDYTQVIIILKKLLDKGALFDESKLAKAFKNRGIAYDHLHELDKAIVDFQESITIHWELVVEGKSLDKANEFASVLTHLGATYWKLGKISEAISAYTQAIVIRQKLLKEEILPNRSELIIALRNRGVAYSGLGKYQEAITDYTQAITIQQKLLNLNKLLDENELANSLINRGTAYWNLDKIEEALNDGSQALNITRSLLPKRPSLIGDYIRCVSFSVEVMKENERTEKLEELIYELHETLNQYELTDEAQYWLDKISELLK